MGCHKGSVTLEDKAWGVEAAQQEGGAHAGKGDSVHMLIRGEAENGLQGGKDGVIALPEEGLTGNRR